MPAGATIGAGVLGAGAQIYGAQAGAKAQTQAAMAALDLQKSMYNQTRESLNPWVSGGQNASQVLAMLTGTAPGTDPTTAMLTKAFNPTMEQLAQTPGYQFVLDQGLKATQNSYAAKGLASSGAAIKGAADYAEGLAGTTYQQQFQNYWNQNQNIYNMLSGQSSLGENAAAMTGNLGATYGNNMANLLTGAGSAQAGANVASGNALATGLNNAATGYMNYNLLQSLLGKSGGAGGGGVYNTNLANNGSGIYTGDPSVAGFGPTYFGGGA